MEDRPATVHELVYALVGADAEVIVEFLEREVSLETALREHILWLAEKSHLGRHPSDDTEFFHELIRMLSEEKLSPGAAWQRAAAADPEGYAADQVDYMQAVAERPKLRQGIAAWPRRRDSLRAGGAGGRGLIEPQGPAPIHSFLGQNHVSCLV